MEIGDWKQLDFRDVCSLYTFVCSMLYYSDHPTLDAEAIKLPGIQEFAKKVEEERSTKSKLETYATPVNLPEIEHAITLLGRWNFTKEPGGVVEQADTKHSKCCTERCEGSNPSAPK